MTVWDGCLSESQFWSTFSLLSRLSFYSGHASFGMYCMLFLAVSTAHKPQATTKVPPALWELDLWAPGWSHLMSCFCIWTRTKGLIVERGKRLIEWVCARQEFTRRMWTVRQMSCRAVRWFPGDDEGKACAVFCVPGLSSSMPLALCLGQALLQDGMLQEAKQSN